ncbi:uncharacterized protein LOC126801817 [Argentina anserina]|uniref:uncharacterized protein LOC126801817 n=1 Tax=Argentina anserina TaxID=57926 RepID=UPI0021766911|nr:uncharacterized protein LOC126801817 [Potentilla anserina]
MTTSLAKEQEHAYVSFLQRLSIYREEHKALGEVALVECIEDDLTEIQAVEEFIQPAPTALDDTPPKVKDQVEKINLGTTEEPMEVGISKHLDEELRQRLVELLHEFRDCFAEKFEDMPGLSPELVYHRLPIMEGYKPVQQSPRRMSADTAVTVKKEVQNMFQAGIIRPAKYSQWLSNIVPVRKKNGKIRVCVDYRNLNTATPKDVYPMPVADMLVDAVAGHELLSFMDGIAGYHQIPVYEPDRHKTAFRCPGFTGVFEYNNMPFGLTNAGATYQRAMNLIFHDVLGGILEVYIDDVVVKSKKKEDHIENLRTRYWVAEDKAKAVLDTPAPRNKKELQSLLGKINFLRRFISNSPGKTAIFFHLLKLKADQEFQWRPAQQAAFDKIKEYLTHPHESWHKMVMEREARRLSMRFITSAEPCTKLRHYMLSFTTVVVAQSDLVKCMLTKPMLRGRIGKWILALSEFSLQYTPLKALTGQAVSDFLLHHPIMEDIDDQNVVFSFVHTQPWVLYFDGISTDHLSGVGVALVNPSGAEYETIIIGLELLLDLEVTEVEVLGDSLLVINQFKGVYKCNNFTLLPFWERASELLDQFVDVVLDYIPRERNFAANELAQLATGICLADGVSERILKVQRCTLPSFMARKEVNNEWLVAVIDTIDEDWRQPIIQYLTYPSAPVDKRVRYFATNYVLRGGELLRRVEDGLFLRCIYGAEAKRCLREVHCGTCGSHQAGPKMRWLISRYSFYWPTMLKDCISFAQGYIECQMHVPDVPMQPIIKPWPGRDWALDFIGEIHHNSSLQHKHILLATDFFTKWVEAIPVKTTSSEVITDFIFKYIITRYGIPECLVADRGPGFMAERTQKFLAGYEIKFMHSSPYYAQANGQAEASNRVIMWKGLRDASYSSHHREKLEIKLHQLRPDWHQLGRLENITHGRYNSWRSVSKEIRDEHAVPIGSGPEFGSMLPDARRLNKAK